MVNPWEWEIRKKISPLDSLVFVFTSVTVALFFWFAKSDKIHVHVYTKTVFQTDLISYKWNIQRMTSAEYSGNNDKSKVTWKNLLHIGNDFE